jgi:hypothetical protein
MGKEEDNIEENTEVEEELTIMKIKDQRKKKLY